jgi:hypothetical protein
MTADEAVSMAAPRGLWHAKHDGSVSGPEFASQPATLAWWQSQAIALSGMMKALLHGGMRSHDGDRCGLHVNIGSDAFTTTTTSIYGTPRTTRNADHMYRFLTLVTANPRWSTRMAQRTHDSAAQWARFDRLASESTRRDLANDWAAYGSASHDRYTVVNLGNEGRVEFRLPRGTLRVDRFFAKIEWTAAMVEFTRNPDNAPTVPAFIRWATANKDTYPALVSYMQERFAARFSFDTATETEVAA